MNVVVVVVVVVVVGAIACDRPVAPDPPQAEALACGAGGEHFAEYGFVPPGVRAAARLRLDTPEFDASLQALAETARGDGHGLPIDLAFAFGQWSWQVPLVVSTLGRAGHRPSELSGGEMQRVAIARALANRPSLLLADEPTGELDQATGSQIVALLDRLHADGTAVVVVTHDVSVAARAHRLIRMRDGAIVEDVAQP